MQLGTIRIFRVGFGRRGRIRVARGALALRGRFLLRRLWRPPPRHGPSGRRSHREMNTASAMTGEPERSGALLGHDDR
jgi:hypothetical protein